MRWVMLILTLLLLAGAGLYVAAGRGAPPAIAVIQPGRLLGQQGTLEITAAAPGAQFSALAVWLEQDGRSVPLFSIDEPGNASIAQADANSLRIARPLGRDSVPELRPGPARLVVTASRPSLLGLRSLDSLVAHDFEVRFEPPRLAVVSTHHHVNHGGSELVLYRVTPPDAESGVRAGDRVYPGYPAAAAGIPGADPSLHAAFFALLHDQELTAPVVLFARDEAGNEATARFVDRVFPRTFRRSRIALDDRFLERVVPEIQDRAPDLAPEGDDLLSAFLAINGPLREANAAEIAQIATATAETKLWDGPFAQLGSSKVEAGFADYRTYVYQGRDVDQQVHLGFDLAVTAAVAVGAANTGRVLHAGWLGIYGNTVILDHGLGVASLYSHLSSIDVAEGEAVAKGRQLGRSGMTGLAGGDHLHFTVLLQGQPVNPVEWWDPQWMRDRVDRKLAEAAAPAVAP